MREGSAKTAANMHFLNYRLFVPKTFRSQERKVPMEKFRSRDFSFRELSFLRLYLPGNFVPGTFHSGELSLPYLHTQFYNSSLGLVIV